MDPTTEQAEELTAALAALASSSVKVFGEFAGRRCVEVGWENSPEGERATEALRSLWGMIGEDNCIYIGERKETRSISEVIEWAIEQCETRDTSEVSQQLAEFRRNPVIKRMYYALIPEIWMDTKESSFTFHDGTVLASMGCHPDRKLLEDLGRQDFLSLPVSLINLFIGFCTMVPCHFGQMPQAYDESDSARLQDIVMCINLSKPVDGAIALSAKSSFFPGNTPLDRHGHGWAIPFYRSPSMQNGLIEPVLQAADQLYEKLLLIDDKVKDRIRVAARFLSHMGMAEELVDQLISLRIALEAFFVHPPAAGSSKACEICGKRLDVYGITAQLKDRAALLFGRSEEERTELRKLFSKVYGVLSHAAHTGRVTSKYNRAQVNRVAELLRQAIGKMIQHGREFDWNSTP